MRLEKRVLPNEFAQHLHRKLGAQVFKVERLRALLHVVGENMFHAKLQKDFSELLTVRHVDEHDIDVELRLVGG